MKIFTVIAVVCYLFVATNSVPTPPLPPPLPPPTDLIKKCSRENDVPLEQASKLVIHLGQASNQNEKCLLYCYLDGRGYFVNGKVDFDRLLELHKNFVPSTLYPELTKLFKECEASMDYNQDNCNVAYQVYQCANRPLS
uniref:Putative pbp/gobp family n=1 Tax=Panstrongylus lignarius TaxID=156445 RepID=A0A224XW32_9HEMI